jgi:hypothetical protein
MAARAASVERISASVWLGTGAKSCIELIRSSLGSQRA